MERQRVNADETTLRVANSLVAQTWSERLLPGLLGKVTRHERSRLLHDMQTGFEELVVTVARYLLHEEEQGGPFLFLQDGPHVLALSGQWMFDDGVAGSVPLEPSTGWPSRFRLVRAPTTGHILSFEQLEMTLVEPELISTPLTYFGESYIFTGEVDEILATLPTSAQKLTRPEE